MARGSEKWFRHTSNDIRKSPDGITLDTAGLSPFMTAVAKMLPTPPAEKNHQYWLDLTREVHVVTAPVFGFILVRDLYNRPRALRAGRIWQRKHLWAMTRGIAMQPINQPTEMVDRERFLRKTPLTRRALDELTGDAAWRPTFAFRAGYPLRKALASPRRRVAQVLV